MKRIFLCLMLAGGVGCGRPLAPTPPSTSHPVAATGDEGLDGAVAATSWMCVTAASERAGDCPARAQIGSVLSAAASAPAGPSNLFGIASGARVSLTWRPPAGGDAPTSYVIEAGSAPGVTNLANYDTGITALTFIADDVPAATYYIRVRAKNAAGLGPASNEVVLSVVAGCAAPPGAPTGLAAAVTGSTAMLTWTAPAGSCVPTSYVVEAGTSAGSSNLASFDTGSTFTSYTERGVEAGLYYVRVRAKGAGLTGSASNEATVTVLPTPLTVTSFVAFGDSITAGESGLAAESSSYHPSSTSRFHPTVLLPSDQRYPTILQQNLAARYRTQTPTVRNEGVSGEAVTHPGTLSRFANIIAGGRFSVVLIMEGINDLFGPADAARNTAVINGLREMVRHAKSRGVTPYLATIPPVDPRGSRGRNYPLDSVAQVNDGIRAVAFTENVTLADVSQGFGNDLRLLGSDGLHPNADGYTRIATVFYNAIKSTLEAPSSVSISGARVFPPRSRSRG